jgi:hypothetical protein
MHIALHIILFHNKKNKGDSSSAAFTRIVTIGIFLGEHNSYSCCRLAVQKTTVFKQAKM